jgi:hypothetical protein
MNSKIVIGIVIGIVVGLIVGLVVGALLILPTSTTKTGTNNQVTVSGTISETGFTEIEFTNIVSGSNSSALIINQAYSIVLVGGQSYTVQLLGIYGSTYPFTQGVAVPSGVKTFTANF